LIAFIEKNRPMNLNWMCIPVFVVSLLLFAAGQRLYQRSSGRRERLLLLGGAFVCALPGITFSLYYTHLFDKAMWFDTFCALPGSELSATGAGLFAGVLASTMTAAAPRWQVAFRAPILAMLCLGLAVPYVKPLIAPIPEGLFTVHWRDGVCLQTTYATCGPACAATILKKFGIDESEQRLARECHSYRGGTEAWYLARALRRRGLGVQFLIRDSAIQDLPCPAIAGVKVNGMGHFITILEKTAVGYVIGDPIPTVGKREIRKERLQTAYQWVGFFMAIKSSRENQEWSMK
jgi:hypothetical protein